MAAKTALTVNVKIDGARETLAAFRRLPKEANDSLRERSMALARSLADKVADAARGDSAQSALMAPTVRARRDRVPVIEVGGTRKVGRHKAPAWAIVFLSEFGGKRRTGWYANERYASSTTAQHRPHLGRGSYWIFRTVEANQTEISEAWNKVAADIEREFTRGGGGT